MIEIGDDGGINLYPDVSSNWRLLQEGDSEFIFLSRVRGYTEIEKRILVPDEIRMDGIKTFVV
jgi:hypothetical protein